MGWLKNFFDWENKYEKSQSFFDSGYVKFISP